MIPHKTNLMKRMLKRAVRARGEHGIALLFTLCILSMALIVAMIFSSNASTGRKVAAAHVDTSAARILADGVVNRAILALMQSENASYVCSNYNTAMPKNGSSKASEYASDWIWKLEKSGLFSFHDGPLRFNRTNYYDRDDTRCPSWEYVFTKNGYGDPNTTTERIYGRYAYVAIGQNDQLNPNAIGRTDYSDFDKTAFQKRLGRWTSEPQFIFKSSRNNWDYSHGTHAINPETIRTKYDTLSEDWEDIDVFVNDMTGGGSSAADKQLKMMADMYFDVTGQLEYNKFSPDGKPINDLTRSAVSGDEAYRFPLIRNDWDSISLDTVKSAIPWFSKAGSGANVNQTVANLINYNASPDRPPVTDNDNWISGEPTYTGNKCTPYINEVHADVSVGGHLGFPMKRFEFVGDPPTTRVWYLWYTDCTYNHEIKIDVETVNMYPSSGVNAALSVVNPILVGEISYEYLNPVAGDWIQQTIRFDAGTQWEVTPTDGNSGYRTYSFYLENNAVGSVTTPERGPYDRPMGHDSDFYEYIKVRNVKLSLDRVVLRDNSGRNADLALMPTQLQTGRTFTGESVVAGAGDFSRRFYFDTQANDPRQNLNRNDWSAPAFAETDTAVNSTIGNVNNTISLGSYHDNEKQTNPAYAGNDSISTAYIRHGQMQSLWELGAIHRGAPWQTINLKCAPAKGNGMEAYQNGDGHLLDQIALTTQSRIMSPVIGMINLNCVASFGGSSAPFVFKSLFTDLPVFRTYAAMNDYKGGSWEPRIKGDSVDSDKKGDTDADALAADLSEAVTYAISHGNLPRRTAVFPTQYPASGSQMENIIKKNVNDAEAEEIFCRVVNLLKWNKQPLKRATILVLAQTIKDIGGASLERVLSDKEENLLYDAGFRAFSNDANGRVRNVNTTMSASSIHSAYDKRTVALKQYDNFYDEITGEAKIIVRLEWDESANDNKGAWKVTRKEYAE